MSLVKSIIDFVMDVLETIVFVGSIFIVIYLYIMQPHQVKGASMEPTFDTGDYILTSKITYKFDKPERGDIIVFKSPRNPDIDYIKRIIGLPGDTIMIKNGQVFISGVFINEAYLSGETNIFEGGFLKEEAEVTVPEDHFFVMGDNRPRSSDSREFGFVPENDVIGKVFFRYYPVSKWSSIKNPWQAKLVNPHLISLTPDWSF